MTEEKPKKTRKKTEKAKEVVVDTETKDITTQTDIKAEANDALKQEADKTESKKTEKKKEKPKIKKDEAIVRAYNVPISTKESSAICKFIKRKNINKALNDLNEVVKLKKAVPMGGEVPHRKGEIMAGRYPQKATKNFVILLKSLLANANANEINEPIIVEAFANIGERPYGRFGRTRKKRAHIFIRTIEKSRLKELNKKQKH